MSSNTHINNTSQHPPAAAAAATTLSRQPAHYDYEATSAAAYSKSSSCRSVKIVCGILLLFGAVIILSAAVTFAIIFLVPLRPEKQQPPTESTGPQSEGTDETTIEVPTTVQKRRAGRGGSRADANRDLTQDCFGEITNDSYPAAHIVGTGRRWNIEGSGDENEPLNPGYQTSWVCKGPYGAFVDGGMFFNQTEETLQVPECGYYYISSKISFQVSENTTQSVKHEIKVDLNCSNTVNPFRLRSHASVGAGEHSYASTFIGDVLKICAGGKISIHIPATSPCCPYGDSISTYLSVHLVQKTGCPQPSS